MAVNDMSQQLLYGKDIFYLDVHPGVEETQGVPFVFLEDIQDAFPGVSKFMCGRHVISFMRDVNNKRLMPLRFACRPGVIIEIAKTESSTSLAGVSQESSPNNIASAAHQAKYYPSVDSVELTVEDKFQQSVALFEKEQADLIRGDFQHCFSALEASMARIHDLHQQMNKMQQHIFQMQQQALDRLAVIYGRATALLTQPYELHEYPIPRLFIVLPNKTSTWDPASILNNQFQLYFLCECGEHTKVLNNDNTNIPHHIHLAKHEGYDLHRPKKFFQKYGRYMLTLLEMIKYGVTIAGFTVPALAAVSAPGAIDAFKNPLDTILQSAVNQSIEYLQAFATKSSGDQNSVKDDEANSFSGQDALVGADLRHLEVFIKGKDEHRVLGNLYRTVTQKGHVKWVCIDHYRLGYKEKDQHAFAVEVEMNRGSYDPQLGQVAIRLQSKIRATEFFDVLANARGVVDLDISFDWECSRSDIEALENALKKSRVSILRLDLHRLRISLGRELISTPAPYEPLVRIMEHINMKIIHIVLPKEFVKLSSLQPTQSSRLPKLSLKIVMIGRNELGILAETLKTNTTLTTLDLGNNSIKDNGALALSDALKTNSTLITLNLGNNSIGDKGAVALSDALKTNSTLITLNLRFNSIGVNGAVALSDVLKTNSTLTTLNLEKNSIGDNGAVALSDALKVNSTLITLNLRFNSIGDKGAVVLSEALKTNSTLTTLNLGSNSIGENGAVALSDALKTNSTLSTLDLGFSSIRENGAVALSDALKTNSTLTTLNLENNSIEKNGAVALSDALKTNSTLTTLHLYNNLMKDKKSSGTLNTNRPSSPTWGGLAERKGFVGFLLMLISNIGKSGVFPPAHAIPKRTYKKNNERLEEILNTITQNGYSLKTFLLECFKSDERFVRLKVSYFYASDGPEALLDYWWDNVKPERVKNVVSTAIQLILKHATDELDNISHDPELRLASTDVTAEKAGEFKLQFIIDRFKIHAPSILLLLDGLTNTSSKDSSSIVPTIAGMLAFHRNRSCNYLQMITGLYLFSKGAAHKLVDVLNHAAMSVSYRTVLRGLDALTKDANEQAKIMAQNQPWYIVYDNINMAFRKYDQRLSNQDSFDSGTTATVVISESFGEEEQGRNA
ncbi:hypothetical protein BGZ51_009033, partial [Haplosporangium sp. Z 767]